MFRPGKKPFADFTHLLASDTVRNSKPFDLFRQAMFVCARELEEDKDKNTTITSAVYRPEENAHFAKRDEQDNQVAIPEKSADLKQKDDESPLQPSLQLGIDNFLKRLRGLNTNIEDLGMKENRKMQEIRNDNRKAKDLQEQGIQVKTRFIRMKAPPQVEARFQEEKRKYYAPLAKAHGISVEEYFKKLDQKSLQISENKEICTRMDGNILKKLLKEDDPNERRFRSQFETGTSNAELDLDSYKRRIVERDILGNYDPNMKDNHNRIIYGYLAKSDQVRGPYDEQGKFYRVDQYGDVVIVFKRTEEFKRRTSFTVGDSLDHIGRVKGVPYENPNGDCFVWGGPGWPEEMDPLDIKELDALPVYVEAQIHYGVSLEDIARVVLTGKAVQDQELIDLLKAHKIRVNRDLH